jgi:hypothetical protein
MTWFLTGSCTKNRALGSTSAASLASRRIRARISYFLPTTHTHLQFFAPLHLHYASANVWPHSNGRVNLCVVGRWRGQRAMPPTTLSTLQPCVNSPSRSNEAVRLHWHKCKGAKTYMCVVGRE